MSLTKVQPSGLDQTQNYSVNQLSANTVLANGVNLYAFANAAFEKANTASTGSTNSARTMINSYIFGS